MTWADESREAADRISDLESALREIAAMVEGKNARASGETLAMAVLREPWSKHSATFRAAIAGQCSTVIFCDGSVLTKTDNQWSVSMDGPLEEATRSLNEMVSS